MPVKFPIDEAGFNIFRTFTAPSHGLIGAICIAVKGGKAVAYWTGEYIDSFGDETSREDPKLFKTWAGLLRCVARCNSLRTTHGSECWGDWEFAPAGWQHPDGVNYEGPLKKYEGISTQWGGSVQQ